jgi:hypothetical protein
VGLPQLEGRRPGQVCAASATMGCLLVCKHLLTQCLQTAIICIHL